MSDTDSGIILHSGSDSPTSHTKDVTTHTRAMKLKHQALQERLEMCLLELKQLCIKEAELTGKLPEDYPLKPGEKPPQIRRRVGAAFKLDELSIPHKTGDSELTSVDAELALQMKIYEAARKLREEDRISKAVRKSRIQQCKREELKLKQLQEKAFKLRLERGRTSPLPAFNITQLDQGTSDDSSLSDSVVQDEEVTSQSSVLPFPSNGDLQPASPRSTHTPCSTPCMAPPSLQLTPCPSPRPSLDSNLSLNSSDVYEPPPIEHSPWSESSLDQPYQKSKKTRSSSKKSSTPVKSELLPPLEEVLPVQLSHLKLSRSQSNSTPSTPEMRVNRQLSLRLSGPESPYSPEKERGRNRTARRRLTEYSISFQEPPPAPSPSSLTYTRTHASSEDSNSEHSFSSYNSSPCHESPCDLPKQYYTVYSNGSYQPQVFPHNNFYLNPKPQSSPTVHKAYYNEEMVYPAEMEMGRSYYAQPALANRYEYWYKEAPITQYHHPQRAQRLPEIRLPPTQPPQWDHHQNYSSGVLPKQVVNEQLKSWHRRSSQLKAPRSRSLDRQGAVRFKNTLTREPQLYQTQKYQEQMIQRRPQQRPLDDTSGHWLVDDGTHYISQV